MSSLKMTFSLASLVLILGLIAMPVMAQDVDVTLGTGDVPAHGFGVIAEDVLFGNGLNGIELAEGAVEIAVTDTTDAFPDLEDLLDFGVTIVLAAPTTEMRDGTDNTDGATDIRTKDIVISEIMWGLNVNATAFGDRSAQQYIELYNSVPDADAVDDADNDISVDGWRLFFFKDHPDYLALVKDSATLKVSKADGKDQVVKVLEIEDGEAADIDPAERFVIVDIVSNISTGGYTFDIGQSGALRPEDTVEGVDPKDIVSAYRNINYKKVEEEQDAETKKNRGLQLAAMPNGEAKGSWIRSTRNYDSFLVGSPGAQHRGKTIGDRALTPSSVDRTKVIVNEIGNSDITGRDWVEFRNVSETDAYNLANHLLSYVQKAAVPNGVKDNELETSLINFKDVDAWIPAGGVFARACE